VRALRSVRARLLLMVTSVVLVAVVAVGWTSRRGTRVEFGQFVSKLETEVDVPLGRTGSLLADLELIGEALQESFRSRGDWSGAEGIFAESEKMLEGRVALWIVGREEVVAVSDAGLRTASVAVFDDGAVEISGWKRGGNAADIGDTQAVVFRGPNRVIRGRDGAEVGLLYVMPVLTSDSVPHLLETMGGNEFLGSVDRRILGAVVVVGLLALAVAVVVSGRIVGPIEELTEASRRMGGGHLAHRVEVHTSDEIGELARAFNTMAASLERNEKLRRNMVSDVAHELRTPLTNLRGQLESVQDGLSQPTPELIASLHEETMLLSHLVDDLQDLALAEAGQLRMNLEAIDVETEVRRAAELFDARCQAHPARRGGEHLARLTPPRGDATAIDDRASIRVEIETDLPPVQGDLQRLRQVLRNLLDNAFEHGGGEIAVTASRMPQPPSSGSLPPASAPAAAAPEVGYVAVTVADSGPGIAAENIADVFERFYRTDPSRQRATGGAGLGLAIVRQLVEAQGGRVWVESEHGRGSVFGFCLPAFRPASPPRRP